MPKQPMSDIKFYWIVAVPLIVIGSPAIGIALFFFF